jgi:hypothetical protein
VDARRASNVILLPNLHLWMLDEDPPLRGTEKLATSGLCHTVEGQLVDARRVSSATEFCIKAMAEGFSETTLMMVEALLRLIVNGTNVDHDIASAQNSLIILLPEYGLYSTLQDFNYIEEV